MKKKIGIILAVIVVAVVAVLAVIILNGRRSVSINTSYETVAENLKKEGYEVTLITGESELEQYNANGLVAVVLACSGSEKLETPDEDQLENYKTAELFYFSSADQAESYYLTENFQLTYQAWSDAYYHIGERGYSYYYNDNVAYAGLKESLNLCK